MAGKAVASLLYLSALPFFTSFLCPASTSAQYSLYLNLREEASLTTSDLSPFLLSSIRRHIDIDSILAIQDKAVLWPQLKIATFARIFVLIHSAVMLRSLTVIRMSILARYEVEPSWAHEYLALSRQFFKHGIAEMVPIIRIAVAKVMDKIPVKSVLTAAAVSRIIIDIQKELTTKFEELSVAALSSSSNYPEHTEIKEQESTTTDNLTGNDMFEPEATSLPIHSPGDVSMLESVPSQIPTSVNQETRKIFLSSDSGLIYQRSINIALDAFNKFLIDIYEPPLAVLHLSAASSTSRLVPQMIEFKLAALLPKLNTVPDQLYTPIVQMLAAKSEETSSDRLMASVLAAA